MDLWISVYQGAGGGSEGPAEGAEASGALLLLLREATGSLVNAQ